MSRKPVRFVDLLKIPGGSPGRFPKCWIHDMAKSLKNHQQNQPLQVFNIAGGLSHSGPSSNRSPVLITQISARALHSRFRWGRFRWGRFRWGRFRWGRFRCASHVTFQLKRSSTTGIRERCTKKVPSRSQVIVSWQHHQENHKIIIR